ncbi:hypothetical protein COCMIDRAFT_104862 [Bipolaris oryzae ATCC 44560]|uniref:Uncharacterized protein n=1 Tax=Bipolaris oryzae ATCC 44560 TaxID=930090 RepID=W6YWM4_COCMI|nr:uncharacterized protein COCMIDRAFT_104862 [Bipolaris oryzae ATCC 44560]EUC41928.1 hypothetical protein COCMIDRAFT_104862 [Bipolaris oryzae ATCC 44560]
MCRSCNPLGTTIRCGLGLRFTIFVSTTLVTTVSLSLTSYLRDRVHTHSGIRTLTWFM